MAEHLSVSEIEKEAKKLKRELEGWREVILPINSVLMWEKSSYLWIILGSTSVFFFLLWRINPSILSMISYLGIIVTTIDYFVPIFILNLCHPERWTSAKERKLESICRSLAAYKIFLTNSIKSFYRLKTNQPGDYYFAVIVSLCVLAYIGNLINNLFLSYLIVTSLLLFPGMQKRGMIEKYTSVANSMMKSEAGYAENVKSE